MFIFFGSQTGTAEGYSRTIMEEGKDAGFDAKMVDLEEFDPEMLKDCRLALFLMATYGEGEPTDNSARFIKWLKNEDGEVPDDFLSKVQFSVFGLGNKQYEHFNRMGKLTNSLLEKLGAKRAFEYGQGDDDGTLEEDFEAWKSKLWPALTEKFINANGAESSVRSAGSDGAAFHKVNLQFNLQTTNSNPFAGVPDHKHIHNSCRHFFTAPKVPVAVSRELRNVKDSSQGSTKHIDLDLSNSGLQYETADNLAVLPQNCSKLVEKLGSKLGFDLDEIVSMEPLEDEAESFKAVYPTPCSIRDLLTNYLDIQGELKQGTLRSLVFYVADPTQRAWLEKMLHAEHRAELKAVLRLRSFVDLLDKELSSLSVPLVDLLHILPPIQPRYYTISSSALAQPTMVSITVSLTQSTSADGKVFTGLCSGYLCGLKQGVDYARVFVRPSTFRLPKSISTPLVLIGPGTGIAPMHAFLQERKHLLATKPELRATAGPIVLFFGCRYSEVDWIYKDELLSMVADDTLTYLYLAFSRDSSASHDGAMADDRQIAKSKVYVQHLLQEEHVTKRLVDWLKVGPGGKIAEDGAHVYVCGATNMGHDVMAAMQKIVESSGCTNAAETIKLLQEKGRYVQELWSA